MLAIKENREYTITEESVQRFVNEGYDIYGDNGQIIAYGEGKTVPFQRYVDLVSSYEAVERENAELRKEVAHLKASRRRKKEE